MSSGLGEQLRACGRYALPTVIEVGRQRYALVKVFKHDFFACTALYGGVGESSGTDRVVLKIGRMGDLVGLPLAWVGEALCRHEWDILRRLQTVNRVPRLVGRYGRTGFVYEYIEGRSLDEQPEVGDDFFDELAGLLTEVHRHRIAYVDMNKRGNILVGADGRPHMIDFQISLHIGGRLLASARWADWLFKRLCREDVYHLNKHKRRIRNDLMSESELTASRKKSDLIELHRKVARPLTRLRRWVLGCLFRRGHLLTDDVAGASPESDPGRWDS